MGFTVRPSNGLKFYRQPTKMQGNINRQNVPRGFVNLTVSLDLFRTSGS